MEGKSACERSADRLCHSAIEAAHRAAAEAGDQFVEAVRASESTSPELVSKVILAHEQHERSLAELGRAVFDALSGGHSLLLSWEIRADGQVGVLAVMDAELRQPANDHAASPHLPVSPPPPPSVPEESTAPVEASLPSPRSASVMEPSNIEPIVVAEPPAPSPPPASMKQLEALQARFCRSGAEVLSGAEVGRPRLRELAESWGSPGPESLETCLKLVNLHRQAATRLHVWNGLPSRDQRRLLAYAVCQARQVQEVLVGAGREGLDTLFRDFTRWSAEQRPGFVYGLARSDRPQRSTWAEDAHHAWAELGFAPARTPAVPKERDLSITGLVDALERGVDDTELRALVVPMVDHDGIDQAHLVQLISDHIGRLGGHKKLKVLKKRIAKARKQAKAKEPRAAERVPEDWAWSGYTRGRRAAVVGGDSRNGARRKLIDAFGFESLRWEKGWDMRRVSSLVESIAADNIDIVFIIRRFIKHKVTEVVVPACKDAGVVFVPVDAGYGVGSIRGNIERHLDAERERVG
jgi:hypothetical protein